MAKKSKKKAGENFSRDTWVGYFPRKTKTLAEKKKAQLKRDKQKGFE